MTSQLAQLKACTTVVADTGDFRQMAQFAPQDATTNPSLILKAVQKPEYAPLLSDTVAAHRGAGHADIVDQVLCVSAWRSSRSCQGASPPRWMPA